MATYLTDLVATGRAPLLSEPHLMMETRQLQPGVLLRPLVGWASSANKFYGALRLDNGIGGFRIESIRRSSRYDMDAESVPEEPDPEVTYGPEENTDFKATHKASGDYAGNVLASLADPEFGLVDGYWDKETAKWAEELGERKVARAFESSNVMTDGTMENGAELAYATNQGKYRLALLSSPENENDLSVLWASDWPWLVHEPQRIGRLSKDRPSSGIAEVLDGCLTLDSACGELDELNSTCATLREPVRSFGPFRDARVALLKMVAKLLIPSRRLVALLLTRSQLTIITSYKSGKLSASRLFPATDRRLDGSYQGDTDSIYSQLLQEISKGDGILWAQEGALGELKKQLEIMAVMHYL